jgi:hypothetical protein
MTGKIDVEDVLSKLNTAEKVSLLSGQLIRLPQHLFFTNIPRR